MFCAICRAPQTFRSSRTHKVLWSFRTDIPRAFWSRHRAPRCGLELIGFTVPTTAMTYKLSTATCTPSPVAFKANNTTRNTTACFETISAIANLFKACTGTVATAAAAAATTAATITPNATAAGKKKHIWFYFLDFFNISLSGKGERDVPFYFLDLFTILLSPDVGQSTALLPEPLRAFLGSFGIYFLSLCALFLAPCMVLSSGSISSFATAAYGSPFRTSLLFCYHHRRLSFLNLSSLFSLPHTVLLSELLSFSFPGSETSKPRFIAEWYPYLRTESISSRSEFLFLSSELRAVAFPTSYKFSLRPVTLRVALLF